MISGLYNGENMMKRLSLVLIIVVMLMSAFTASNGLAAEQADEIRAAANPNAEIGTDFALADLDGTEWVLISFNDNKPNPDTRITLNFSEGIATGFAGCNWYSGNYMSTDAGVLTFFEMASTVQLCEEPEGIMKQEKAFVEAFLDAATYRLMDDYLEISTASGGVLLFAPMYEENPIGLLLNGTEWTLISLDGNKPVKNTRITLSFSDGWAGGRAGCNGYGGGYADAGIITFSEISYTEMFCEGPEGIMRQEEQYLDVLFRVNTYTFEEDRLTLMTEDRRTLVYRSGLDAEAEPSKKLPGFGIFGVVLSVGILFFSMRIR